MKTCLLPILLFIPLSLYGQAVHSYLLDVHLDPAGRKMRVDGILEVDFQGKDSLNFSLWKYSEIESVKIPGKHCEFRFDTAAPSPGFFSPRGRNLVVFRPASAPPSEHKVRITYTADMSRLGGNWEGTFTADWIEMALYSGWYPIHQGDNRAKIRVHVDEGYRVTGSGRISRKAGHWEIDKSWESFDIVLMASRRLKSKSHVEGNVKIQLDYTDLSEAGSDSTIRDCISAFRLFGEKFGKKEEAMLRIVIGPPRTGGGYSRKHFITMPASSHSRNLAYGCAHEIAHFWWHYAPAASWEDWLNEAFAEYSALMFLREAYGPDVYRDILEDYREQAKDTPPVWGIERYDDDAYTVLYMKGSVILAELEERIGTTDFFILMQEVSTARTGSTSELLELVSAMASAETSLWLEDQLRSR